MSEFKNKVAVITGAASGIGQALAARCVEEGMKVVLADIEQAALSAAANLLFEKSDYVIPVVTDVAKADEVEALRDAALQAFGEVHLLFNNAGVSAGHSSWGSTLEDWKWVIDVNLWGVIHGIRTFVPTMLHQQTRCHIVNTASVSGLICNAFSSPYAVTKHAVVSLSESLHNELQYMSAPIGVSVLCPGYVRTNIMDAARNRPEELVNPPPLVPPSPELLAARQRIRAKLENGMPPEEVAGKTFDAIRYNKFYIATHPEVQEAVQQRAQDIVLERNPRLPPGWGQ